MSAQQVPVAAGHTGLGNHDLAVGMLEGYIKSMSDPDCSAVAVRSSANTALMIFRALSIISATEDADYTERLNHAYELRKGRAA
ncbi:hypothetical protein PS718_00437 [Pseudomonas fluorescens]|uniref:Uncharacterized protein n=1 Tax=Pseudomonas fluorescens TaxID=294 RepID=A0A5E6ZZ88_PSEFL|nr:hypothetical protein [Pseudomonas fluorescens]VVN71169.1 hypothetical protein PS718_00437 [Pseudomonas fluorescens]